MSEQEAFKMIRPEEARNLKREAFKDEVMRKADQEIREAALSGRKDVLVRLYKGNRDEDEFRAFVSYVAAHIESIGFVVKMDPDMRFEYRSELLIGWNK